MIAPSSNPAAFADLLARAVSEPGVISDAYRQFHTYSIGNQLLAWSQCLERGIAPRPMATFPRWKELGRYVRKGEKAITLCQPVTVKRQTDAVDVDDASEPEVFTRFVYRPHWFVLAQTDGAEIPPAPIPSWDAGRALAALDIAEIPFDAMDGNVLGFARGRSIAINPVNPMPHKTRFHERRMCCSATRPKVRRPMARSRRGICVNAKRRPWRCCAVRRSSCQASSSAVATFKTGGAVATRSRNDRHSAS
jgi:hypothetical protein